MTGRFVGTAKFGTTTPDLTSAGDTGEPEPDVFVARISAAGEWEWATKAGGSDEDDATAVSVAQDGSAVVVGEFRSTDASFATSPAPTTLISKGRSDVFVARISAAGVWQWAVSAGAAQSDSAFGVSVREDGSADVTGEFEGGVAFGGPPLSSAGRSDVFVARISDAGVWQWAHQAGGPLDDFGVAIASLADGSVAVVGTVEADEERSEATFGTIKLSLDADEDIAFVTRLGSPAAAPVADRGTSLRLACDPPVLRSGVRVTCTVSGGDPGIDILWRAAYNPVFAEAGVTLDGTGSGEFSFVVPTEAAGSDVTVELVEWLAPQSLGVASGPAPTSVPSGGGPSPVVVLVLGPLTLVVWTGLGRRSAAS